MPDTHRADKTAEMRPLSQIALTNLPMSFVRFGQIG
jgi:hypothetical protein